MQVQKAMKLLEAQDKPVTPYTVKQQHLQTKRYKDSEQQEQDRASKKERKSVIALSNQWMENNLFGYEKSTQKSIRESIKQFQDYLKIVGLSDIERKELNNQLITDYERFLQDKKKLSNSTHGKRMKHLRWFLKSINFDVVGIKIRTFKKEIIALSAEELRKLETIDVSDSSENQKAKDMFLLGCYTGLRISDLKRINETRIIDGNIRMTLQKNKKEVTIPVRPETKEILDRYHMKSPKISEPVLNRAIKKVCEKAIIDQVLTIKYNVAGKDIEKRQAKYDLITSHTASKTFITLAPEKFGMTPAEIAAIVGKDLKTLINHYFKLPLESAIVKMKTT